MLRKLSVVVIVFFIGPLASRAQNQFVTSNAYVEADVSADGTGLVTIYYVPVGSHTMAITHTDETSYLTVNVNGNYYTNNQHLVLSGRGMPLPTYPTGYLENGTTSYKGKNKDTIETVWEPQGPNTFDIIQDVYTVEFPVAGSGQVVYKFSVLNLQNKPLGAQAQYLVDVDLATVGAENDAAPITTRFEYINRQVTSYPNSNVPAIPPYFIATLQPLDSENFPLLMAEGYMNDSLAPEPMGLMEPSLFAYVSWPDVVADSGYTWGFPQINISDDAALLLQWPAQGPDSGQTLVIGSFSYGSAACTPICLGNLDAMMIHPEHIVWNGSAFVPNRFPVDGIVWNTNLQDATAASGTQSITDDVTGLANGPVQIVSPLPIINNGFTQIHTMSNLGSVPSQQSSSITWEDTVLASVLTHCSTDSIYNIAFSVAASGVGSTSCANGTYICPIEVDCQEKSFITPVTTVLSRTGSYDGSLCNTRCTDVVTFDTASTRIPVLSVVADTLTNMRLSIAPNHAGADSTFYSVCVIDSMLNGSAEIMVADSLGNSAIEEYEYCTIADTHAPLVQQLVCFDSGPGICDYEVSDSQAWDRGLDTIYMTANNQPVVSLGTVRGLHVVDFRVVNGLPPFTLCITAVDLAGNKFDTCFGSISSVSIPGPSAISLSISPNPTSGAVTIFIEGTPSADVEIFDVLGREVDRFQVNGSYDWEMGVLPSGTYIVRATVNQTGSNSQTLMKRIVKE